MHTQFRDYMNEKPDPKATTVSYFSMEYGLHSSLKIYSGGLGILAGDYLKEASDKNVPMAAVGLLYRYGYFTQRLSAQGAQEATYEAQNFYKLPISPVRDEAGGWVTVTIAFPGRTLSARVWKCQVGRTDLYLLDADIEDNLEEDRQITHYLYGGDWENRLKQEILLGIGGIRALRQLGIKHDVFHCNEGHAAFIGVERIRDLVKKYDLFLFSDEVYREFIYTGSPYISACHLEGIEQNVVLIDSVSKRYSECGIRIGALITKNKTLRNAVMKFCQARLSPPLIGQIIAEASIDAPRSYSTEVYEEYIERRKCLIDGLNRIPGVYSPIPMGAFYTVARLPVDDSDKFCAWCLSDFEYEGETVMMAPASGFYSDPECGRNEVRIAYVLKKEDLERALLILGKALEAYNARK